MDETQQCSTDLAAMVVPPVGRLVATGDEWEPCRLLDPAGVAVEAVAAFLRDLQAAGRSAATLRSYGMDLLRWFRFLWAAGVAWDRATRAEARDFCRWLQVAGKPARPHWRKQGEITTTVRAAVAAPASAGAAYAASVRVHSETVLRSFYDFHRDAGSGPVLNPFPLERSRRGPHRPLTYHAAHRMFERVNDLAGTTATLPSLRHTAASRMAEDPALPLPDVQLVLGHAQLTTTQIYLNPRTEDVVRRVLAHHAKQTRRAAQRASPAPAPGCRPETLEVLFGNKTS
jgi:site-specific recombinase XerD